MFILSDETVKNITSQLGDAGLAVTVDDIKNAYYDVLDGLSPEEFDAIADEEKRYADELNMEALRNKGDLTPDDIMYLQELAGNFEPDENDDDESVLNKYAQHLFNYLYTYKPEAQGIDPNIDPEEEQIGIMAQDLEQVNPACVKEINGAKVVDTGKLALMNAGAIGDIARRLDKLEESMGGSNG